MPRARMPRRCRYVRRRRPIMRRQLRPARSIKNYYKFIRFGQNCTIDSVAAGTVALNTLASGWALSAAAIDHNGLYQFGGAMQFQLDQTLQYPDLSLLFDKYMIKGVKVTILPLGTGTTNATTVNLASNNYATIAIAVDNDDASLPADWNSVAVKQDCKIKRLSKPVSVYIKNPKIASAIYNGATTAYAPRGGFVDMNYIDVPHYGLKFYVRDCPLPAPPSGANGAQVCFRVVTKFYLACKDPQ